GDPGLHDRSAPGPHAALADPLDLGEHRGVLADLQPGDRGELAALGVPARVVPQQVSHRGQAERRLEGLAGLRPEHPVQFGVRSGHCGPQPSVRSDACGIREITGPRPWTGQAPAGQPRFASRQPSQPPSTQPSATQPCPPGGAASRKSLTPTLASTVCTTSPASSTPNPPSAAPGRAGPHGQRWAKTAQTPATTAHFSRLSSTYSPRPADFDGYPEEFQPTANGSGSSPRTRTGEAAITRATAPARPSSSRNRLRAGARTAPSTIPVPLLAARRVRRPAR